MIGWRREATTQKSSSNISLKVNVKGHSRLFAVPFDILSYKNEVQYCYAILIIAGYQNQYDYVNIISSQEIYWCLLAF